LIDLHRNQNEVKWHNLPGHTLAGQWADCVAGLEKYNDHAHRYYIPVITPAMLALIRFVAGVIAVPIVLISSIQVLVTPHLEISMTSKANRVMKLLFFGTIGAPILVGIFAIDRMNSDGYPRFLPNISQLIESPSALGFLYINRYLEQGMTLTQNDALRLWRLIFTTPDRMNNVLFNAVHIIALIEKIIQSRVLDLNSIHEFSFMADQVQCRIRCSLAAIAVTWHNSRLIQCLIDSGADFSLSIRDMDKLEEITPMDLFSMRVFDNRVIFLFSLMVLIEHFKQRGIPFDGSKLAIRFWSQPRILIPLLYNGLITDDCNLKNFDAPLPLNYRIPFQYLLSYYRKYAPVVSILLSKEGVPVVSQIQGQNLIFEINEMILVRALNMQKLEKFSEYCGLLGYQFQSFEMVCTRADGMNLYEETRTYPTIEDYAVEWNWSAETTQAVIRGLNIGFERRGRILKEYKPNEFENARVQMLQNQGIPNDLANVMSEYLFQASMYVLSTLDPEEFTFFDLNVEDPIV
jgi:hypothetical protein